MRIPAKTWTIFVCAALLSLGVWIRFRYPHIAFVDYSLNRTQALSRAKEYLRQRGDDVSGFRTAIVFGRDREADRYLQKTLGFSKLKPFTETHDFELFSWVVRFFKDNETEEFELSVSPATGEVTSLQHVIKDSATRKLLEREEAKQRVIEFLTSNFGFSKEEYSIKGDLLKTYDNRRDYTFSWQKNSVHIPWSDEEETGYGKLIRGATLSGEEILTFSKNKFLVPSEFRRFLSKKKDIGYNLGILVKILYYALVTSAIFFIVKRRNHLVMHSTKKFYIGMMGISMVLSLLATLNQSQAIFFNYPTKFPLMPYLGRYAINTIFNAFFISLVIILPALSGELLHFEVFRNKKEGTFLHYIQSTFLSRRVAQSLVLGYLACLILLGIQSILIKFGQKYLGVWVEYSWATQTSTAFFPFLAALIIGLKASFVEEIIYRFFAISLGKKIFKATWMAVLASSLIWGFGHSNYPVFPMWFRGIEVTCLGLFLSFIYLRFGLIAVISTHFLFDAFWYSAGHLLGKTVNPAYFAGAIFVLSLPLLLAILASILNRSEEPKPMQWRLNRHQHFNLEVLKNYLNANPHLLQEKTREELIREISSHGWDIAVVEMALKT